MTALAGAVILGLSLVSFIVWTTDALTTPSYSHRNAALAAMGVSFVGAVVGIALMG